jgi:hypothetical protein
MERLEQVNGTWAAHAEVMPRGRLTSNAASVLVPPQGLKAARKVVSVCLLKVFFAIH